MMLSWFIAWRPYNRRLPEGRAFAALFISNIAAQKDRVIISINSGSQLTVHPVFVRVCVCVYVFVMCRIWLAYSLNGGRYSEQYVLGSEVIAANRHHWRRTQKVWILEFQLNRIFNVSPGGIKTIDKQNGQQHRSLIMAEKFLKQWNKACSSKSSRFRIFVVEFALECVRKSRVYIRRNKNTHTTLHSCHSRRDARHLG